MEHVLRKAMIAIRSALVMTYVSTVNVCLRRKESAIPNARPVTYVSMANVWLTVMDAIRHAGQIKIALMTNAFHRRSRVRANHLVILTRFVSTVPVYRILVVAIRRVQPEIYASTTRVFRTGRDASRPVSRVSLVSTTSAYRTGQDAIRRVHPVRFALTVPACRMMRAATLNAMQIKIVSMANVFPYHVVTARLVSKGYAKMIVWTVRYVKMTRVWMIATAVRLACPMCVKMMITTASALTVKFATTGHAQTDAPLRIWSVTAQVCV